MANSHATIASLFSDIAQAIREKTGDSENIVADNFPTAIRGIETGGSGIVPSGTKSITENGTHDVTNYASAAVNVDQHFTVVTVTESAAAGNVTMLSGNDFVKANYNNANFVVGAFLVSPASMSGTYVNGAVSSNNYLMLDRYFCSYGSNGTSFKTWSARGTGYKANTSYSGTGYAHIHATSGGDVVLHAPSSYVIAGGTYIIFYGLAG